MEKKMKNMLQNPLKRGKGLECPSKEEEKRPFPVFSIKWYHFIKVYKTSRPLS